MKNDPRSTANIFLPPVTFSACMNHWTMRLYTAYVYLALRDNDLRVQFYDHLDDIPGFEKHLRSQITKSPRSRNIHGIAMFLGNKKNALRLMQQIRAKDPRGLIVAFGPTASFFHRQILTRGLADIVITADPEFVFPKLVRAGTDISTVPNLALLQHEKIMKTRPKTFTDLDSLPFAGQYFCDKGLTPVPVVTARGCPFSCSFCDRPLLWGAQTRLRSVDNIFAEIHSLVTRYNLPRLFFDDANFILNKDRTIHLCQQLTKLPKPVSWGCTARVDCADPKTLRLMRYAGCETVYFGIESGDETILRNIGKEYGQKEILQAVKWTRDAGIKVGIFLTVGNPGESGRSLVKTKKLLRDLYPFSELTINPLVVLPGTPIYARFIKEKKITEEACFDNDTLMFFDTKAQAYMKDIAQLRKFFKQ